MQKILVSGFEPFLGEKLNPSQMLVEHLNSSDFARSLGVVIDTVLLPVSYNKAFEKLSSQYHSSQYAGVLMLGQAGGRSYVGLEKLAVNFQDLDFTDEYGVTKTHEKIISSGASALECKMPLAQWSQEAKSLSLPVDVSYSAGTFICNKIYYMAMSQWLCPSLFVHVPFLPEQTVAKPQVSSLSFDKMKSATEFIIKKFVSVC